MNPNTLVHLIHVPSQLLLFQEEAWIGDEGLSIRI